MAPQNTNRVNVHWTENLPVRRPPSEIGRTRPGSVGRSLWSLLGGVLLEILKLKEVRDWLKKKAISAAKMLAKKASSFAGRVFRKLVLKIAERRARKKLPAPTPEDPLPTTPYYDSLRRALELLRDAETRPEEKESKGGYGGGLLALGLVLGLGAAVVISDARK